MEHLRYHKLIDHLILEELHNGKQMGLRVSGRSMHPLMRQGDSIRLEKCTARALAIGDIITFKKDGNYFTHRLLWTTKRGNGIRLITKGDNEINTDPPVSPVSVIGKVTSIQRGNRTLHLNTPFWRSMNRLFGVFFLLETITILLYRFATGRFQPFRALALTKSNPSLFYRRLKTRGLVFAARIII
jgi:signal peptidase I